jgi:16S rRNA C967 or C1407 C5-methylase (RsmB/RsmF family)
MREKLPCVFRINTANPYWHEFRKILTSPELVASLLNGQDFGIKITPKNLSNLAEWRDLIFNINVPRFELKKNESLTNFHKFIQKSVDAGLISRQEAVSMIPPMLMDVKQGDRVFDMCAAPGSKTAQFLECFYRDFEFLDPNSLDKDSGFVLANDNNFDRAHMMTHQLKRLNTAGMAVISHDAQFFPTIYTDNEERILFDKILADVPCSSDAVLRKLPHKWRKWSPRDSFALHKLQLQILKRGISLLKVGGRMVYSTCSLNPIENEAIIAEIMRQYPDSLEILDMSHVFENSDIKSRPGLLNWKVMVDDKEDNKKLVELTKPGDHAYKDIVEDSCFPPEILSAEKFKLKNCIRLFPHDSDTSGFFITVLKKTAPITYGSDKPNRDKKVVNSDKGIAFIRDHPEICQWLKDFFGLTNRFPMDQLVTHSKISKRINFVSKGVSWLLSADKRNQLKLCNVGVKLFSHNKKKFQDEKEEYCKYRICQDGLIYAIPFMTKRVFFTNQETFVKLLKESEIKYDDLPDQELRKQFFQNTSGCIVLILVKEKPQCGFDEGNYIPYLKENFVDALCCYISAVRITTMINKEHQHVFSQKFNILI